ncbi:MAG TPA: hypothetical protein VN929_06435 [Burkholderiales bacterium]|nr:hypothetical protein [Burkholderiales bacterium]
MKQVMVVLLLAVFTRTACATLDAVRPPPKEGERINTTIEETTDAQP